MYCCPDVLPPCVLPTCAGQVCLFDCIEWLREQLQQWQDEAAAADLAASTQQLGLSSSRHGSSGGSSDDEDYMGDDYDLEPHLRNLPESSSSQVGGCQIGGCCFAH
jgi:hypothetical protein